MGLPARKLPQNASRKPSHLRLVAPKTRKRTNPRASAAVPRQNFQMFCVVVVVISLLGFGRVWLTVQAAEASIQASRLRNDIKTERYEGDMLEVRQSSLGSPSRIRAIAGKTMNMAPANDVSYLDLTKKATKSVAVSQSVPVKAGVADSFISGLMRLTAGEAEVLLVGDIGLVSAR